MRRRFAESSNKKRIASDESMRFRRVFANAPLRSSFPLHSQQQQEASSRVGVFAVSLIRPLESQAGKQESESRKESMSFGFRANRKRA
jgi:hypothetical protein